MTPKKEKERLRREREDFAVKHAKDKDVLGHHYYDVIDTFTRMILRLVEVN